MTQNKEHQILSSWKKNVAPWNKAIEQSQIKSRVDASNKAIVDAILSVNPASVIDIGCGEGWLCRALQSHDIATLGVDAMAEFIMLAQQKQKGQYLTLDYTQCCYQHLQQRFDAAVCNFSLLGEQSVQQLIAQLHELLNPIGHLFVQTLHPELIANSSQSGWREGSWDGFDKEFTDPHPWFYRSEQDWEKLLRDEGWRLDQKKLISHPQTGKPISIIFIATTKQDTKNL